MCLFIGKNEINVAEDDICVVKLIRSEWKFLWVLWWRAYFRGTVHRLNRVLRGPKHLKIEYEHLINKGFHSYTIDYAKKYLRFGEMCEYLHNNYLLKYAIIPKGSEYCYNRDMDSIVSNKLIVFSSKEKFEKYKKSRSK